MAEQRQPFRFKLPWLTPQLAPSAPRPSQTIEAPQQATPSQRPPFRPAGVAPTLPPSRAKSQPPSQSQPTSQPTAQPKGQTPSLTPQAPPVRATPQPQVTSPARQINLQPQPTRSKVFTSPPKPTELASKMQSDIKPKSLAKPPPSQEPKRLLDIQGPEQKKGLEDKLSQVATDKIMRVPKGINHDEPKTKKINEIPISSLKPETREHSVAMQDERCKHPSEEAFDKMEVMDTSINDRMHTDANMKGNEKVRKFPYKATTLGEKPTLHRDMKEGSRRLLHKLRANGDKNPMREKPFSIITLTGENTGAIMHLNSESTKTDRPIHIHRGYKINQGENLEATTDGEGSSKAKNCRVVQEFAKKLYVNNNTQGVNNSLFFSSSVTEGNPGVHVALSRDSHGTIKPGKERNTVQTQKAEVAFNAAKKLAYAPTIKRRCLRGLLMESSDSDTKNPKKPQRHGCLVACDRMSKNDMINAL